MKLPWTWFASWDAITWIVHCNTWDVHQNVAKANYQRAQSEKTSRPVIFGCPGVLVWVEAIFHHDLQGAKGAKAVAKRKERSGHLFKWLEPKLVVLLDHLLVLESWRKTPAILRCHHLMKRWTHKQQRRKDDRSRHNQRTTVMLGRWRWLPRPQ